ncbi:hypothetical protein TGPRC2_219742 [Toxoplasma gondii TgCatPRC2]|uniref:Transmembrane protein n=1 Tax=Toxoplasma gondii TgCatPRC2 TaxID=1130821 RepID=A0A151HD06_TOXGO|nr:hypothetical protein TGPRC2_219742 [Toxoplasma gondii TgCatPRC2]
MKYFITFTVLLQLFSPTEGYSAVPRRPGGHRRSLGDTLDSQSPRKFSETLNWETKSETAGESCSLKALETAGSSPSAKTKISSLRETEEYVETVYEKRREASRLCASGQTDKCESPDQPLWETLGLQKPPPCPTIQSFKLSDCEDAESTTHAKSFAKDSEGSVKKSGERKKRVKHEAAATTEASSSSEFDEGDSNRNEATTSRDGETHRRRKSGVASRITRHYSMSNARVRKRKHGSRLAKKLHTSDENGRETETDASSAENHGRNIDRETGTDASGRSGHVESARATEDTYNGEGSAEPKSTASSGVNEVEDEDTIDSAEEQAFAEMHAQDIFGMIKDMFGNGMEISDPKNFEGGNQGSYFDFMYPQSTDYPWACMCDENQYKRWEAKEIQAVPCRNQVDMSIQGIVAACNPKNHNMNSAERRGDRFYISLWLPALVCLTFWSWH